MSNTLVDLNNYLFAQIERLNNENLDTDKLKEEIDRSKALTQLGSVIINNANTILSAKKLQADTLGRSTVTIPKMLED